MTTKWTYDDKIAAHYADSENQYPLDVVTVPDQIADDQKHHDREGTVFPALTHNGDVIYVRLDGDAYGLWTPGTGDMIVRDA